MLSQLLNPALSDAEAIPPNILRDCHGIMIVTTLRAGLVVSGGLGTGLVIAKLGERSTHREDERHASRIGRAGYTGNKGEMGGCGVKSPGDQPRDVDVQQGEGVRRTHKTDGSTTTRTRKNTAREFMWSAPLAISTFGFGLGLNIGSQVGMSPIFLPFCSLAAGNMFPKYREELIRGVAGIWWMILRLSSSEL